MIRSFMRFLPAVLLLTAGASHVSAQKPAPAGSPEAEVREAIRQYDDALRRADAAALDRFWATDDTFVNPRGEQLTRQQRLTNVRTGQTSLTSIVHEPKEEQVRVYGDVAVYTALMTIGGTYSGQAQQGSDRVLTVFERRDGRWQQVATQMTPVATR